ncbi:MAG: 2-isopropylmalate synthase [Chloroflexi bacterium]|nr:2-isopropylmalate synthase [Chloroflexota bacterium]
MMADYIKILDTTLRDGEEAPGFGLTTPQKVEMAHQLARLGVDAIEAGFPAVSSDNFEAVQRIAREVQGPVITGLARAVAADIDQCWEAIQDAERPRIHTFLPTADMHLEGLPREQAKARAVAMVARARSYTSDVEFSPMDATRSDWQYVAEVFESVIDVGATTVNIPDTLGFAQPEEMAAMVSYLREHVANIDRATISVHCHNDLGVAVANSLAAISTGARQVECCINGIGERAGNAALEEVVMALTVRRDHHHVEHGVQLEQLVPTSSLLQQFTGILVQPNKAVVGVNAFGNDTGLGMPQDVLKGALRARLEQLGLLLSQDELNHAFTGFKRLSDYKSEVTDADLVQIANNGRRAADGVFDAIGHVYR